MLQKILERELASGFASLPGTQIKGKLPVPGALINQALKEAIAKKSGPVKGVMVALLEGNKAIAVVAIDQFLLPKTLELPFTIEPTVAKDGKLIATVQLEPGGGPDSASSGHGSWSHGERDDSGDRPGGTAEREKWP
jgi:hypothetical protein